MDGPPDYEREMQAQLEAELDQKMATNRQLHYAFACLENAINIADEKNSPFADLKNKIEKPSERFGTALNNVIPQNGTTFKLDGFNKGASANEHVIKLYENKLSEWSCEWYKIFQESQLSQTHAEVNIVKIQLDRHSSQRMYLLDLWKAWLTTEGKKNFNALVALPVEKREPFLELAEKIGSELARLETLDIELILSSYESFGLNDSDFLLDVNPDL